MEGFERANHRRQSVCDLRIKSALTDEVVTDDLVSTASCQGATRRSVCLSRERARERVRGSLVIQLALFHPEALSTRKIYR